MVFPMDRQQRLGSPTERPPLGDGVHDDGQEFRLVEDHLKRATRDDHGGVRGGTLRDRKADDPNLAQGRRVEAGQDMEQVVELETAFRKIPHVVATLPMGRNERRLAQEIRVESVLVQVARELLPQGARRQRGEVRHIRNRAEVPVFQHRRRIRVGHRHGVEPDKRVRITHLHILQSEGYRRTGIPARKGLEETLNQIRVKFRGFHDCGRTETSRDGHLPSRTQFSASPGRMSFQSCVRMPVEE